MWMLLTYNSRFTFANYLPQQHLFAQRLILCHRLISFKYWKTKFYNVLLLLCRALCQMMQARIVDFAYLCVCVPENHVIILCVALWFWRVHCVLWAPDAISFFLRQHCREVPNSPCSRECTQKGWGSYATIGHKILTWKRTTSTEDWIIGLN